MSAIGLLRRHASAAWRHRWKALAASWALCLIGWVAVQLLPNRYESHARLYADADALLGTLLRGIAVDSSPAAQMETLQRTLLSRPNLEKVAARTGLDLRADGALARERLLDGLARDIRIRSESRNLFALDYHDSDPRMARDVLQAVLNLFIENATGSDRQQMDSARAFVAQQIATYEAQLREAERRRAEFRARYVDLLPTEANGGVPRLEAARTRLQQVRGELQDAIMRRDLTRQQLENAPAMVSSGEGVMGGGGGGFGGGSGVAEAERNLRELRLRYTEQHPDVIAARAALAAARASGGGGGGGAPARALMRPNPLHEQLRVRMVDAEAQVASLERQVRDGEVELERLDGIARTEPELQARFTNLDRDYNVLRRNYEELLARRESVQITGAARSNADRVRLEVVDPPTLPLSPAAPNRVLFSAGVLALGLGAGIALAILLVQLDQGFYTVQDLRELGLPVLGGLSALALPRARAGLAGLIGGYALLLVAFGAVLAGGQRLFLGLPDLMARFMS